MTSSAITRLRIAAIMPFAVGATVAALFLISLADRAHSLSRHGAIVWNGNDSYLQFRNFLRSVDGDKDRIWVNIDARIASPNAALPIYQYEWHGLSRVWHGEFVPYVRDRSRALTVPWTEIEGGLVAFDQTRTRRADRPSAMQIAEDHGVDWLPVFTSSGRNAGMVVVFDTERSMGLDAGGAVALPLPALVDGWRSPRASVTLAGTGPSGDPAFRIADTDAEGYGFFEFLLDEPLSAGAYMLRFSVAATDDTTFGLARLEFVSGGGSLRYDLRFRPSEDGAQFLTQSRDGHARVQSQVDSFHTVSYHLALPSPAQSVLIRIYPAAGREFPSFSGEAVGSMVVAGVEFYRTSDYNSQ